MQQNDLVTKKEEIMARPKSEHATTTIRVKVSNKNYLKKLDEQNSNLNDKLKQKKDENK